MPNSLLLFLLLFSFFAALSLLSLRLFVLGFFFLVLFLVLGALVVTLGVDCLADLHGGVLQSLESFLNLFDVLRDDGLVEGRDVTLNLVLDVLGDASGVLLDLLLSVVNVLIGFVLNVDDLLGELVGLLGGLGLLDHAFDVGVGESTA